MEYTLKNCQELVDEWIQTIGIRYFSELTNIAILMEEVGELARIAAREYGDQSYKESDKSVNLAEEMADVLFVLVCLANQTGVDLKRRSVNQLKRRPSVTRSDIGKTQNSFQRRPPRVKFPL